MPLLSLAATDYACVNDCTNQGYMYNLCTQKCSYNTNQGQQEIYTPKIKQIDYQCVNDCTAKGYQYNFCQSRCSY
jgi:hypothetical protein